MRKLLGWTVGLVLALPLAGLMASARFTDDKRTQKTLQRIAYAIGLSDVQE